jgi:hypothetical protein
VLAALPWPFVTFPGIGAAVIVLNEHVLHRHLLNASRTAGAASFLVLLGMAARSQRIQQSVASSSPPDPFAEARAAVPEERRDLAPPPLIRAVGAAIVTTTVVALAIALLALLRS